MLLGAFMETGVTGANAWIDRPSSRPRGAIFGLAAGGPDPHRRFGPARDNPMDGLQQEFVRCDPGGAGVLMRIAEQVGIRPGEEQAGVDDDPGCGWFHGLIVEPGGDSSLSP